MSDDHSARLALPYLAAGQMQKHVTLNEALTRLDALVQTVVVSRTTTAQPAAPVDGSLWIMPAGATGIDWSSRPVGTLMRAEGGGWAVVETGDGLIALVEDADAVVVRHGGDWAPLGARLGVAQALTRLGVGTTADGANPFAARLNSALWTALEAWAGGTGDLRLTLNKEAPGDVLSLLFQSGWSGRAELGLVGDDDLRLKVSADGASWHDAFAVDRATGRTTFAQGAGRRTVTTFTADGSYAVPTWARSVEAVMVGGGGGGGAGSFGASGSRFGGGGGGAGGISRGQWPAELLGGTLDVVVGIGGLGGNTAAGSDGSGGAVSMGGTTLLVASGGGGGGLGGSTDGEGGSAGEGAPRSNAGGASSVTTGGAAGRSLDRPDAPGGGGAGGGLDGAGVARVGGAGGDGGALAVKALGGAGGLGAAGSPGTAAPQPTLYWAGGGGGGGGAATSGSGHAGASGGSVGGGGGGGGAGVSVGGVGGAGGPGVVRLTAVG
ncbi:DUF2793 domain-containing protein [Brevundimonas sp.]|uniref:DUF2793 domain-containing protein n=1 Tax=Brevundimonas sp. TaxID=1871086 RepID=UPI002731F63A|nr:DUF2793 domain-containing protein [Brevundimonas sp.]MDP1913963.1 DUF2793 domain-containing protein [Brevundimonas sp.]